MRQMARQRRVHGIPCSLEQDGVVRAVRQVLSHLRDHFPDDYHKLKAAVRSIEPLSEEEMDEGTLGWWRAMHPDGDDPSTWGWGFTEPAHGTLYLWARRPLSG